MPDMDMIFIDTLSLCNYTSLDRRYLSVILV